MKAEKERVNPLLAFLQNNRTMTRTEQIKLVVKLSLPAILAEFTTIIMQYIDASMVGSLGAHGSAAIGLIATTTWLFGGVCMAVTHGFSVQVAHLIGAGDRRAARSVFRQGIFSIVCFSLLMLAIGVCISPFLPLWLGGDAGIVHDASLYFLIFSLSLPIIQLNMLAGGMLRCSGNMKVPSLLNVLMCVLDILFNFLLIFPSHDISWAGISFTIPGANMGVLGAAVGTTLAELIVVLLMMWFACFRSFELRLNKEKGSFVPTKRCLLKATSIALPMGMERTILCGAQIVITAIIAPLGIFAVAANALAVTAESLCYMPGYGVADAATTLVGQSIGAERKDLTRSFAHISVLLGMGVMTVMGVVMYVCAPMMMRIMTPVPEIIAFGVDILRIEAFAEPMFAAAIVTYGVFTGAGYTLVPSLMNMGSMWLVRITLAAILAPMMGLRGVWVAMCIELCFRGTIFLIHLHGTRWLKRS